MTAAALSGKKYSAYAEYKDSGVDWVGNIPSHWDVWKFKHTLSSALLYGANEAALDENKNDPRYIRITDMNDDGSLRLDTFKSLPMPLAKSYLLDNDDILLARSGATVGKSFLYSSSFGKSCFAGYLIKASCNKRILNPRYAYWFCQSDQYWKYISGSQIQSTIQNVSAEKYGEMKIPFSLETDEQQKIANFLDHETAKIDTLITKQEKLIALLKEKRQAVISHAVTRGLNPTVPMKDSGVEWLGEVPEHWVVKKLKFCAKLLSQKEKITTQKVIALENIEGRTGKYITTNSKYSGDDVSFNEGDILFGKLRPYLSKVFLCETSGIAFGDILAFRPNNETSSSFLFYTMISEWFIEIVNSSTYGSKMPRASSDFINEMEIAFPPVGEQIEIAEELNTILGKFEILTDRSTAAIELMKERKTALISAAVTGKIDVRNFNAEKAGS